MSVRSELTTALSSELTVGADSSVVASSVQVPETAHVNPTPGCYQKFIESYFGLNDADDYEVMPVASSTLSHERAPSPIENSSAQFSFIEAVPEAMGWKMLLPVTELVMDFTENLLPFIGKKCPANFELLCNKSTGTYQDALQELILARYEFEKKGNPKQLVHFLNGCLKSIAEIKRPADPKLIKTLTDNIQQILQMLSSENCHLMRENVLHLYREQAPDSSGFKFHVAANSYAHLAHSLDHLTTLTAHLYQQTTGAIQSEQQSSSVSCTLSGMPAVSQALKKEFFEGRPDFPRPYKIDIYRLYKNLGKELAEQNKCFFNNMGNILASEHSLEMRKIISRGADFSVCHPRYVREAAETYRLFLPHIKENKNYLSERCASLAQTCEVLSNFSLYLKFGNLELFQRRLDGVRYSARNFRNILVDEILKFSIQKNADRDLLIKVITFLKTEEGVPIRKYQGLLGQLQRFYSRAQLNIDTALEMPLQMAERKSQDLFPPIPQAASVQQVPSKAASKRSKAVQKLTPVPLETVSGSTLAQHQVASDRGEMMALGQERTVDSDRPETAASSTETTHSVPLSRQKLEPMHVFLERLRGGSSDYFGQLRSGSTGFETVPALDSANQHFTALASAINRFSRKAEGAISRAELFSVVADCVQHGNLGVEQMLSALDRESNSLSNRDELNAHLSHNLIDILFNCKFASKDFSPQVRQWISSINRGELSAREVTLCPIDGNFAQKMLVKAWLYSTGSEAFGLGDIGDDLASYLNGIGTFCGEYSELLQMAKTRKVNVDKEKAEQIQSAFTSVGRRLGARIGSLRIQDQSSSSMQLHAPHPMISEIRSQLISLRDSAPSEGIKASYGNILSNLLVRLENEVQLLGKLHPAEASLHYSNVLLLDQMIAEHFLQNVIDARGVVADVEIAPHDLLAMVKTLGINEELFSLDELNFLSRGRETMSLCRYTSSYKSQYRSGAPKKMKEVEEILDDANKLKGHVFSDLPLVGYAYAGRIGKTISDVEASVQNDLNLLFSIQRKILAALE